MAFRGPWGTFVHIPKCGGVAMRKHLILKFKVNGEEIGMMHGIPDDLTGAWTIVRHPANWLLSYYTYLFENRWRWADLPEQIAGWLSFADGLWWPQYVEAVCTEQPGVVGKVFDLYCKPGMQVFQLEKIDLIFDEPIPVIHETDNKPLMTDAHWDMICKAEAETLRKYEYNNNR